MLELCAPAKINLWLRVLSRRPDGYHLLDSRLQKLDFGDRIRLGLLESAGVALECDDPGLPSGSDNLAVKAARRLLAEAGAVERRGVWISLEKRIPTAAGLGGGSSDAGAVLTGLNQLLGEPLVPDELSRLALELGADVPFFTIPQSSALAAGVGERLTPVPPLRGFEVLLVNPGIAVSTRWVFENYALTSRPNPPKMRCFHESGSRVFTPDQLVNDLESTTISRYPVVGTIKEALLEAGAEGALMSGSGPTVFGLFRQERHTTEHMERLSAEFRSRFGPRVYLTRASAGA